MQKDDQGCPASIPWPMTTRSSPNAPALPVIAVLIYINNMILELPGFFLDIYGTKTTSTQFNPPLCI